MKRYQICGEKSAMVLSEEGHWVTLEEYNSMKEGLEKKIQELISLVQTRSLSVVRQLEELHEALDESKP